MITMLLIKVIGLAEFFLDYIITVQYEVAEPSAATGWQWSLVSLNVAPTAKGWAILADVWTLIHNALDMLAQFSATFPVNSVMSVGGTIAMPAHASFPPP